MNTYVKIIIRGAHLEYELDCDTCLYSLTPFILVFEPSSRSIPLMGNNESTDDPWLEASQVTQYYSWGYEG